MSNVIDLNAYRKTTTREESCRYCGPGWTCAPHRLADLAVRLEAARGTGLEDEALTDALAVIGGITATYLTDERTAK